eukprot:TRINITY_DN2625_c0_g1_i1.p1 TRINITY_DN2625_c0_g1~~TRINITY_DN2625_c0_g1_i1.p1  ORF type:complete len:334 (+),score=29.72 TRINITY_DN2625_c0_g1_i1:82-1083(+)
MEHCFSVFLVMIIVSFLTFHVNSESSPRYMVMYNQLECPPSSEMTWNATRFLAWVRGTNSWTCALRLLFAHPDAKKYLTWKGDFVFRSEMLRILASHKSELLPYAQTLYVLKQRVCLKKYGWCNFRRYFRLQNVSEPLPPPCTRSYCYFKPASKCSVLLSNWTNLTPQQRDEVKKVNVPGLIPALKDERLTLNRQYIPLISQCVPRKWLRRRNIHCPISNCKTIEKNKRRVDRLMEALVAWRASRGDEKKRAQLQTKNARVCGTIFPCASCFSQNPDDISETCLGYDSVTNAKVCCSCSLNLDPFLFDFDDTDLSEDLDDPDDTKDSLDTDNE